eukprot:3826373-Karenia_brevis.AAC.1
MLSVAYPPPHGANAKSAHPPPQDKAWMGPMRDASSAHPPPQDKAWMGPMRRKNLKQAPCPLVRKLNGMPPSVICSPLETTVSHPCDSARGMASKLWGHGVARRVILQVRRS